MNIVYGFKRFHVQDGQLLSTADPEARPHVIGQWERCDDPGGFYFARLLETLSIAYVNTCASQLQAIYLVATRGNVHESDCKTAAWQADEIYIIEEINPAIVLLFGRLLNWELLDPSRIALRENQPWNEAGEPA